MKNIKARTLKFYKLKKICSFYTQIFAHDFINNVQFHVLSRGSLAPQGTFGYI